MKKTPLSIWIFLSPVFLFTLGIDKNSSTSKENPLYQLKENPINITQSSDQPLLKELVYDNKKSFLIKRGQTLPITDHVSLTLFKTGTEFSVPEVEWKINQEKYAIPLKNFAILWSQNELITLTKQKCATQTTFTDVKEITVIGCVFKVERQPANRPEQHINDFKVTIPSSANNHPLYRENYVSRYRGFKLSKTEEGHLVYLSIPEFFVQNIKGVISGGVPKLSGSESYIFNFQAIIGSEIGKLIFTPQELYREQVKSTILNAATLSITPRNSQKNSAAKSSKRISNQDFSFDISIKFKPEAVNFDPYFVDFSY